MRPSRELNIRVALFALYAANLIRLRALEDGRYRVAQPEGHPVRVQIEIDVLTGAWHERGTTRTGHGYLAMSHRLQLPIEACLLAMGPAVAA